MKFPRYFFYAGCREIVRNELKWLPLADPRTGRVWMENYYVNCKELNTPGYYMNNRKSTAKLCLDDDYRWKCIKEVNLLR